MAGRPPLPLPLIALRNASFLRTANYGPIFANTSFTLPSWSPSVAKSPPAPVLQKWAVLGPSKSKFLAILSGAYVASPPGSRSYPLLSQKGKWPQTAFEFVSFGGGGSSARGGGGLLRGGTDGHGYLSARYETLRERFDQTLQEWLEASIEPSLNPYEDAPAQQRVREAGENRELLGAVMNVLQLQELAGQAVMTLSNGQARRARVAQALLRQPELLLVDEPFLGLDPTGQALLASLLDRISSPTQQRRQQQEKQQQQQEQRQQQRQEQGQQQQADSNVIPVILGLRPQDAVPAWCTHLVYVEDDRVASLGEKTRVVTEVQQTLGKDILLQQHHHHQQQQRHLQGVVEKAWTGTGSLEMAPASPTGLEAEPLVEMEDIRIAYYNTVVLDNFSWTIRRGEKWGLFGPNGSGKTTLTSLITSDHPLTYALPIKHFGRARLPEPGRPGMSVFQIQARIGLSSPELHAFFPRHLSLRRCVESGFAPTFLSAPSIPPAERTRLDTVLGEFEGLLDGQSWERRFGDADLSTQRLALFLRATVPRRDLVVYDEAFSGMRRDVCERCFAFLSSESGWEDSRQAMVCISHASDEVPPGVDRWVRLGEKGGQEPAVFGRLAGA